MTQLRQRLGRAWQNARQYHWADALSLALLCALSVVMLLTLSDYGLTYDEEPHIRYGERVLDFYSNGLRVSGTLNRSAYGAGFDLAAALLRRMSPWDEFETNHWLCVFVAQLGLLGTWKLGRLAAGPVAGFCSLVFLALTPVYYGHQFNNPKDIPFAAGYVWGLYFVARLLSAAGAPPAKVPGLGFWLKLSLALGLAMSVRVAGAIVIAYLLCFTVLSALDRLRLGLAPAFEGPRRAFWLRLLGAACGSWLVMLVFWPRALRNPVAGPAAALETVSRFAAYDSPTLLNGRNVSSQAVPWDYIPTYFVVQLPELISLCFVASAAALFVHTARALRRRQPITWLGWLLLTAVLLPPLYAIVRHSTLYNGLRHFLFLIPPLSVMAGSGVSLLLQKIAARRPLRVLVWAMFSLFVLDQVRVMRELHPHQHVFFNRASGGLVSAVKRYETEYYGSVYRELGAKLVEEIWNSRRDAYLNTTYRVAGCGSKLFFTKNLPLNFEYSSMGRAGNANFYATYVRDHCLNRFTEYPVITAVERQGARLAVARDLDQKKRPRIKTESPEAP